MKRGNKKAEHQGSRPGMTGKGTPWLEWGASAVGVLTAVALLSLLVWDIIQEDGSPPVILITTGAVTPHQAGFTLEISVRNASPKTAAQVEIEGSLREGTQTIETARTLIDYVPGHSNRRGGLFFVSDPAKFDLQVRALGYAQP